MKHFRISAATAFIFGVASAGLAANPASASTFVTDTLGSAADFAILETGTGNTSISNGGNAGFVTGNVGVNGGNLGDSGVPITGNVVAGTAAAINPNVAANVSGTVSTNQATLSAAVTAAMNAAATFAGLSPTLLNTSITGTTTINLTAGTNVVDLSTVNLGSGQTLTLNGPAGSDIVLNVTGGVTLNSGHIVLTGGLTPDDVVFNLTGTQSLSTSGGLNNESTLAGIFLALNAQIALSPGAVTGEIISGQNIGIASGASVDSMTVTPLPATLPLFGSALAGLGLFGWRRKRRAQTIA